MGSDSTHMSNMPTIDRDQPEHRRESLPDDDLVAALRRGIRRIAKVVRSSPNSDMLVADRATLAQAKFMDDTTVDVSVAKASQWLTDELSKAKNRSYRLPKPDRRRVLCYGYTRNNKREIEYFSWLLRQLDLDCDIVNLAEQRVRRRYGVNRRILDNVISAFELEASDLLNISPALLTHLRKFALSVQSAYDSLIGAEPDVFCVANDHSPAPVAFAVIAEHFGFRTVYLQHAEVSSIFPSLDFDLSILRNARSRSIYKEIGISRGDVVVASRNRRGWTSPASFAERQRTLSACDHVDVVVYPSAVIDRERYSHLVERLTANLRIDSLSVKPHPNPKFAIEELNSDSVTVIDEIPPTPHVAVCGNSAISIELIAMGCIVFQDSCLDGLTQDYYGFVREGVVPEIPEKRLDEAFWCRWGPPGEQELGLLADYLSELCTVRNVFNWFEVAPALLNLFAGRASDSERAASARRRAESVRMLLERHFDARPTGGHVPAPDVQCEAAVLSLAELSSDHYSFLAFNAENPVGTCRSALDLWAIHKLLIFRNISVCAELAESIANLATQYAGTSDIDRWVRRTARTVLERNGHLFSPQTAGIGEVGFE